MEPSGPGLLFAGRFMISFNFHACDGSVKIFSIDAEKAFEKIQHPITIKTVQKTGTKGTYLNVIKILATNKAQDQMASQVNSTKNLEKS